MCDEVRVFRVIRIDSDVFTLEKDGEKICCRARKAVRKIVNRRNATLETNQAGLRGALAVGSGKCDGDLRVGDYVRVLFDGEPIITDIQPRRNSLIRPAVANVDAVVIVVAPCPQPDLLMVDKLIVNCKAAGISPVVCLNKNDLPYDFESLAAQYGSFADDVISVSATAGELDPLKRLLVGRLTAFAGQSAVGKSSLTNALTGLNREVGGVSEKIGRGRNTTTRAEILPLGNDTYIVDTPGFSMLDVHATSAEQLADGYGYTPYARNCRFGGRCSHTTEPDCAVRRAVQSGRLDEPRYERYVSLYKALRNKEKYGRR